MLADTILGRENITKLNAKEFLYLHAALIQRMLNLVPFLIAHMSTILKKKEIISFGGLITSLARAIGLNTDLAKLEPLPLCTLDLNIMRNMRLYKVRR